MADSEAPVAVVSGGNRGLGLELCRQLLQRGWPVVALCRQSSAEVEALSREVGQSRLRVIEKVEVAHDACMALVRAALGGAAIGLLICNAGILGVDTIAQLDTAGIKQQFEVNALGPLRIVHALSAQLAPTAKVAIVGSKMGSIAATLEGGKNGSVGYRMSKAAVNMAAQLLAMELRPRGISVLLIHPGAVTTDMYRSYWAAARGNCDGASGSASGAAAQATDGSGASASGMAVSAHGPISPQASAAGILQRLEELTLARSGQFMQAASEEVLPW